MSLRARRAGVLGGMGPEATLVFLEKFYRLSRGRLEQERPPLLVDIDPGVPDRNDAWRRNDDAPGASLVRMGRRLRRAGADFCVMPCITAHGFAVDFERESGLPLLGLPSVVAQELAGGGDRGSPVGLLATTTTLEMQLFQHAFSGGSRPLVVPDPAEQEALMEAIYAVKRGREGGAAAFDVATALARRGARTLVLACTDLSVLDWADAGPCEIVDSLDLLARHTLAEIEGPPA